MFIVLFSCQNKRENIELEYYETGELYKRIIYPNLPDSTSFIQYSYYKDGTLKAEIPVDNGERNGRCLFYDANGILRNSYIYDNGVFNGIQLEFDDKGLMTYKVLTLGGIDLCMDQIENVGDTLLYTTRYKFDDDDEPILIGEYCYNSYRKIVPEYSFAYITYGNDTIEYGKESSLGIKFYGIPEEDYKLMFFLGDINSKRVFTDTLSVKKFTSPSDSLIYTYTPTHQGENLILGMVVLEKDGLFRDYVYYHDIYAK